MQLSPSRTAESTPPGDVASVKDLCVTLGGVLVLDRVSFSVGTGEAVALMGANGSGKSTAIRALLGLAPGQGDIRLFGTPRTRFRQWSRLGYVPQRQPGTLGIATVREVVASGVLPRRTPFLPMSRALRTSCDEALERVGLAGRAGDEMATLSGGQQQRVLIARALADTPEFMILDEPMAGVDVATQEDLATVFAGLKADGMAMLVVIHELGPLSRLMDRAVVLRGGRVVHDGDPLHRHEDGHEHVDDHHRPALVEPPLPRTTRP